MFRKSLLECLGLIPVLVWFLQPPPLSAEQYKISTTWDNRTIDHDPVTINLERNDNDTFRIEILAPFFNDSAPDGVPGEPFYGLWDYEVAEVFFLNDQDQYLEIELAPYGQHILLMLNGYRKTIRHSLFIYLETSINGSTWQGTAIIPVSYLPPLITKMNAYAIHGLDEQRVYESLYPVAFNSTPEADFHYLAAFQPFDSKILVESYPETLSPDWKDAIDGVRNLEIVTTWNGVYLDSDEQVFLKIAIRDNVSMEVTIEAPFYNDTAPEAPEGALQSLSEFEVVHLLLLGENDLNVEIQFGPWGHYLVKLSNGVEQVGDFSYQLDYKSDRRTSDGRWNGTASVPLGYLPPKIYKCNAHSVHGSNETGRQINSLYPVTLQTPHPPDFYDLSTFKALDFSMVYSDNDKAACSSLWSSLVAVCNSSDEGYAAAANAVTIVCAMLGALVAVYYNK